MIAVGGVVECDRCFGMLGCDRCLGCGECDRCYGDVESAIAVWEFGSAIAFWGYGSAIAFKGYVEDVRSRLGMWESDSEALRRNQKIKLPHLRMARDPLNLSLHAKPVEPPPVPLELYKKSNSP